MTRPKLLFLKNAMLVGNALANFVGVFLVQRVLFRAEMPSEILGNPVFGLIDIAFTPCAFTFVTTVTLIYEKPFRRYMNALFKQEHTLPEFETTVRRRILNEPFVLILLDFGMWLLAPLIYSFGFLAAGAEAYFIKHSALMSLSTGLITVVIGFFLSEHISQKRLAPYIFPEGGLSSVPGTLRIRIHTRMAALFLGCNLIPLFSVLHAFYRIASLQNSPELTLDYLRPAIITNALVFVLLGGCLSILVSRNLTLPLGEILDALQRISNDFFDRRVQVISNDEIGYTGDVINAMTEGLKERDLIKDAFGKYVSKEVRDEVLSGKVPLDGEKKNVTVLFADLRDFTPLTEKSDPKMVVRILNSYFAEMTAAIQTQGGLVLQFLGDEIYAVFGAPISRQDHASRAFRAALEMSQRLRSLNAEFDERGWPRLRHGIGIHTGDALAANIGSPDRLSYLLVGDTVNLASRFQSLTKELGTEMVLSATTHSQLSEEEKKAARLSRLPPREVKGRAGPVELFVMA